jgi:O-antigen ligase
MFIFSPITSCSLLFILAATASLAVSLQVSALAIFSSIEVITSVIVISLVVPVVTNSRQKLRLFVLTAALSSGLLAAYYGVFGLLAGSFSINGPGKIGDNNGYAVWVCSTIPLIFVSARRARPRWAQMALFLLLLGNMIAVALTFSRGGLITLIAVLALLSLRLGKGVGAVTVAGITYLVVSAIYSEPTDITGGQAILRGSAVSNVLTTTERFLDRMRTLRTEGQEIESAVSRVHFFRIAVEMFLNNPVAGVGYGRYPLEYDFYDDTGGLYGASRAVHNTWLSILSETGLMGTLPIVLVILFSLGAQQRALRLSRELSDSDLREDIQELTYGVRVLLIGFIIGGSTVSCITHETFWLVPALSLTMLELARKGGKTKEESSHV